MSPHPAPGAAANSTHRRVQTDQDWKLKSVEASATKGLQPILIEALTVRFGAWALDASLEMLREPFPRFCRGSSLALNMLATLRGSAPMWGGQQAWSFARMDGSNGNKMPEIAR